jgi:hypothetical protein
LQINGPLRCGKTFSTLALLGQGVSMTTQNYWQYFSLPINPPDIQAAAIGHKQPLRNIGQRAALLLIAAARSWINECHLHWANLIASELQLGAWRPT